MRSAFRSCTVSQVTETKLRSPNNSSNNSTEFRVFRDEQYAGTCCYSQQYATTCHMLHSPSSRMRLIGALLYPHFHTYVKVYRCMWGMVFCVSATEACQLLVCLVPTMWAPHMCTSPETDAAHAFVLPYSMVVYIFKTPCSLESVQIFP